MRSSSYPSLHWFSYLSIIVCTYLICYVDGFVPYGCRCLIFVESLAQRCTDIWWGAPPASDRDISNFVWGWDEIKSAISTVLISLVWYCYRSSHCVVIFLNLTTNYETCSLITHTHTAHLACINALKPEYIDAWNIIWAALPWMEWK